MADDDERCSTCARRPPLLDTRAPSLRRATSRPWAHIDMYMGVGIAMTIYNDDYFAVRFGVNVGVDAGVDAGTDVTIDMDVASGVGVDVDADMYVQVLMIMIADGAGR